MKDEQSKPTAYLVGKYEVRDYEHSYDVPYNKKIRKIDILLYLSATRRKRFLLNLTTIFCNNDLSDYEVINEATLNAVINTLLKEADERLSSSI